MNTMFREVLQEVLMGLPIMEPNKSGGRIKRRCPRTKRVSRWSGFMLGCHAQSIQERERERGRETKNTITTAYQQKKRESTYAWKCMNMWRAKRIASWVQPNPNLTAHNFQHPSTPLNAWNIVKMQMECNVWSYINKKATPNPKVSQKSQKISKTPKFSQNPKNRGLMHEIHEEWGIIETYLVIWD